MWEGTKCISQQGGRKQISGLVFMEFCRVDAWGCAWLVWMVSEGSVGAVPTHLPCGEGKEELQTAHFHHG